MVKCERDALDFQMIAFSCSTFLPTDTDFLIEYIHKTNAHVTILVDFHYENLFHTREAFEEFNSSLREYRHPMHSAKKNRPDRQHEHRRRLLSEGPRGHGIGVIVRGDYRQIDTLEYFFKPHKNQGKSSQCSKWFHTL